MRKERAGQVFLHPVTVDDVAEALQCSPEAVRVMRQRGKLPPSTVPSKWRREKFSGRTMPLPRQPTEVVVFAVALVRELVARRIVSLEEVTTRPTGPAPSPPEVVEARRLYEETLRVQVETAKLRRDTARDLERMRLAGELPPSSPVLSGKPAEWSAVGWDLPDEPLDED